MILIKDNNNHLDFWKLHVIENASIHPRHLFIDGQISLHCAKTIIKFKKTLKVMEDNTY